jgi:hypothetical protein
MAAQDFLSSRDSPDSLRGGRRAKRACGRAKHSTGEKPFRAVQPAEKSYLLLRFLHRALQRECGTRLGRRVAVNAGIWFVASRSPTHSAKSFGFAMDGAPEYSIANTGKRRARQRHITLAGNDVASRRIAKD